MKIIYLLLLVTLVTSENVFECLFKNQNIIAQAMKVIDSLKTKDFSKIMNAIFQAYLAVNDDVIACFQDEPNLKFRDCCYQYIGQDEEYLKCQLEFKRKGIVC